ncbi:hypothetical protein SDC9_128851 [bioreactor metagenome]|uniref:DUF3945 domain-containing protein n=1 Tax=bioreactor metagenome TaxID=1076179 RepID=A0A645CXW9_9ZZZZ
MLMTGKSPNLYPVTIQKHNGNYNIAYLRLEFFRNNDGKIGLNLYYPIDISETFEKPFYGYTFSKSEQSILLKTGNLGKVINLIHPYNGSEHPCFVSLDPVTNYLAAMESKHLQIPEMIYGVNIEDKHKAALKEGKMIRLEGMRDDKGNTFSGFVQVNANVLSLEVMSDYDIRIGNLNVDKLAVPTHYRDQVIPPISQKELCEGRTIRMSGENGSNPIYIRMNFSTGQPEYSKVLTEEISKKPLSQKRVSNFKI